MIGFQTWLESAANYETQRKTGEFSLKTISLLANNLCNPQNEFNSVHIAGSKGKGSVSTMVSSIFREAGFSEGLYTSPHILHFLERVGKSDGRFEHEIYEKSATELISFIEDIAERLDEENFDQASWFELMTLFAFLCFKNAKVDWAVFETGLGGRLDATNVLAPKICAITPIELEHTEFLGDTIKKIATEKAGIIKKNVPVCVSPQTKEAFKVIKSSAKKNHSPFYYLPDLLKNSNFCYKNQKMQIELDFGESTFYKSKQKLFCRPIKTELNLLGEVQVSNAALASLIAKIAVPNITEETIEKGLSSAFLPGRFEIINRKSDENHNQIMILDGAHTINSISYALKTYKDVFNSKKYNLLFACAYDKKIEQIAPLFFNQNTPENIFLTKPGDHKASNLQRVINAFYPICEKEKINVETIEDYSAAIDKAIKKSINDKSILFVVGSFYLVSEVKNVLRHNKHFLPVEG